MSDQDDREKPGGGTGGEQQPILTNRQGHPVYDNQNTRTVGDRESATKTFKSAWSDISHSATRTTAGASPKVWAATSENSRRTAPRRVSEVVLVKE